jgi:hypothetical protein
MVVEIQTNGTLRIYHGYPGQNSLHCCNVASQNDKRARDAFGAGRGSEMHGPILAFLQDEFPGLTRDEHLGLLSRILDTMYSYDPGIGVNRPQ